ncbi:MAG: exodeoxyribonuclease VII large subunit [Candidatus Paracaedibacteraceae bacterium]|nr:exodeoxyribonuclease VII large subunit [Candidatus Paracaedibacteraceae bacterium]
MNTQRIIDFLPPQAEALSVTEISLSLKKYVEDNFRNIKIRGEISGYKRHTSGHSYFTLKDEDSVIDAVAWRGTPMSVQLEDGLEVIITGRITTYPGRSKYQVIVERLEAAGKGALMKILMERKERLQAEGLFDNKRQLPPFPKRIGIITSPTGAVIRDILHRLEDRFPCEVILWPAQVQGPGSIEQVAFAIRGMNVLAPEMRPDVLIVARGGGSLEDLWTFNEEAVVRVAATSIIPIISAIGHETDTTLIDYAADLRAPTPTAAAELATPVRSQLIFTIRHMQERMHQFSIKMLRLEWIKVKGLARGLPQPQHLLETSMQRLDDRFERLTRGINHFLTLATHCVQSQQPKHPTASINMHMQNFNHLSERFLRASRAFVDSKTQEIMYLTGRLDQSSYSKILEKGFAWTSVNNTVVSKAADFPMETTTVTLHYADGNINIMPKEISKSLKAI